MTKTAIAILLISILVSCSDKEPTENLRPEPETEDDGYVAPDYPDDYRPYASWAEKDMWGPYNVHDPSMEQDGDWYYVFGTNASFGNAMPSWVGNFPGRRSRDLIDWEFIGCAMSQAPRWAADSLNNKRLFESQYVSYNGTTLLRPTLIDISFGYWAPCVRKIDDRLFRMYYSMPCNDEIIENMSGDFRLNTHADRAFIGLMEASSLAGPWTDKGMVICTQPDGRRYYDEYIYVRYGESEQNRYWAGYYRYNAIDPSMIIDAQGRHWLVYGSWHSGIAIVELDAVTGKTKRPLTPAVAPVGAGEEDSDVWNDSYGTRIAGRGNLNDFSSSRWQGIEGAEIIYNPKTEYYYLFMAYDDVTVNYNTRVCRSRNITGPYFGMDGTNQTSDNSNAQSYPMITHPYGFKGHPGWQGISHCSLFYDRARDKWFFDSQARLSSSYEGDNSIYLMVQHIREVIWTEDGWPLVSPERYAAVEQKEIADDDIVGSWENIDLTYNYGRTDRSSVIVFNADGSVTSSSGIKIGTFDYHPQRKMLTVTLSGYSYSAYLHNGLDWEAKPRKRTLLYTGVTADGRHSVWGKKI